MKDLNEDKIIDVLAETSAVQDAIVDVGGGRVSLTHLDKVYWPADGYTKRDLLRYYAEVSTTLLPYLRNRPLILKRYVNGIDGQAFFQHDVHDAPDFVDIHPVEEHGKTVHYAVCNNMAALLYLVNLGSISFDPWLSQILPSTDKRQEVKPDIVVFDLDPAETAEGMAYACEVALAIREELTDLGLDSYAKTSGASGLHVYLPVKPAYGFDVALDFAKIVARRVEVAMPKLVTIERRIQNRGDCPVYLDYFQNAQGKSVAAPYAVRPRAGATVSAPVTWQEIEATVRIQDFSIRNMVERLRRDGDHFEPVMSHGQFLSTPLNRLTTLMSKEGHAK